VARSVHKQDASYLDVIHDRPGEWNPTDYAYHLTRRARGLPLWFSLSVYGVDAYTEAIETAIALARQTADEIRSRDNLELIREPELGVVLFRRRGWDSAQYTAWADQLLREQVAFIPPSAWEGQTVARFAFLHPHTPMDLVRQILDRMDLARAASLAEGRDSARKDGVGLARVQAVLALGQAPGHAGVPAADEVRVEAERLLVLGDVQVRVQVGDAHGNFLSGRGG